MAPRTTQESIFKSQVKSAHDLRASVPVELLTFEIPEYAAIRRVSRSHVYDEIKRGRLKTVKVGRRRLIPGTEIKRTAEEQASQAS